MVCLETSFLIDILQGKEEAREVMADIDAGGVRPTVTPVSAAELWFGAAFGTESERDAAGKLLETLTWLPITRAAACRAGTMRATLLEDGSPIGITDVLIAATALEHDEVLVTRDAHFERLSDVRIRLY